MIKNNFFEEIHGNFGFGCMRLPMKNGEVDIDEFKKMVDSFIDSGFNYFDTAHGYLGGRSEKAIKECLTSRYNRSDYLLTNKLTDVYFNSKEDIEPLLLSQLKACGVEYFDFYLMHAQDKNNFEKFKRCQAYETALSFKERGLIKHFGISFHDRAEVLDQILNEYPQIEMVQIQLNYLDYEDSSVESRKVYEICEKHNKPVAVMEPVKGGSLVNLPEEANKILSGFGAYSNAGYALRFAAGFPKIAVVLSGMSDVAQLEDNIQTMKDFKPLDQIESDAIKEVCRVFRSLDVIPCTACHYCVEENECPMMIQIPELFSCVNSHELFHNWNSAYYYNNVLTRNGHGKASNCLGCGKCEKVCPQHLPIRDLLKKTASIFEERG